MLLNFVLWLLLCIIFFRYNFKIWRVIDLIKLILKSFIVFIFKDLVIVRVLSEFGSVNWYKIGWVWLYYGLFEFYLS